MFTEDQLLPISALQHLLFCPRQCALIHLEQVWSENKFTVEGNLMHERAHHGSDETRHDIRITRGMPVRSLHHGLSGQCDIVEFHGPAPHYQKIIPVEYKRGKPKSHSADEVQLCAQALCLEEMIESAITPLAEYQPRRCDSCSLIRHCEPKALRLKRSVDSWFSQRLGITD